MTLPNFRALIVLCAAGVFTIPAYSDEIRVSVQDASGKPLPDAVVLAVSEDGKKQAASPAGETIDQIDKEFVPYVKPVRVGTPISFPNKDNIRHHVYSFSPAKAFELPLYKGTPSKPVLFGKKGVVKLGCNIHDWMIAYVYVTDAPYFGATDADGRAQLDGLAPGTYTVWVWHPQMNGSETDTARKIELRGTQNQVWKLDLRPEFRPPRASVPGGAEYR